MPLIPRPFPLFTLRTALLWLVFLPSLLVAAGAVGAGWAVLGQIDGADKAASLKIARGLAAQVEDRLHEAESTVRQLAAALEASPPDRRSEVFTRLSAVAAPFEEIELLDPGLVVRASWPDDAALTGADYSALEPLRRLANESSAAWTDSSVSPRTGRTTASLALPFEGGILWASLDLGRLSALVLQLSDETASVDLVDSRGRYLAHSDPNLVGQPVNEHERLDRLDAGTTSGAVRVASFALPQSGWAVLVTLVREPGQRGLTAAWWFLPVAAALVLAGWGLGLWLNRRLRAGIESLVKQTEGIRRGDLSEALPRTSFRDWNQLLDSFDAMRQSVRAREQDLRIGESRYRRMFDDAAVGIFHSTYDGRLLDLNQAMAALLGYTNPAEALEGLGASTLGLYVRPEERQAILRMLQDTAEARVTVTTEFYHRTGSVVTVNHHLARVFDPASGEFQLEIFAEDVTDLKAAEKAVMTLNQALEAKVLKRTQHLARALDDLETAQAHLVESEKMAALGQLIAGIAHELNTPLGAIHASNDNIAVLIEKVLGDLPPLLRALPAEHALLLVQLHDAASLRIEVLPSATRRARRKALQAELSSCRIGGDEVMVDALVDLGLEGGLERWLPLLGSPQGAEAVLVTDDMISLERSCRVIATASERAAKVINALRTFSHQAQESVFEKVNVGQGLETVLTLFHSRLSDGIVVTTDLDPDLQVWGLADRLNQVWTNLVANAVFAMGDRGTLELTARTQDGTVTVTVADSGPGIPASVQSRVFEPFFTTKRAGEGSGMGLDICRKIVTEHRGTIGFASRPGRTEFSVQLPAVR
jgi:PAS domain S-box-containing protein